MPDYTLPPDWQLKAVVTPLAELKDWSLDFLGIPDLWRQTKGEGISVAVLDTGVDTDHPDLEVAGAFDCTDSWSGPEDRQGHGTWCVGMIGARANDIGVVGIMPKCTIYSIKVLGDNGSGTDLSIEKGVKKAIDLDVDFISLSLGGPVMGERLHRVFQDFVNQRPGRFAFAASGNGGQFDRVNYPARWRETIAVGAVDKNGKLTEFTSRGPELDICAPGYKMVSTIPGGRHGEMTGTSMATPEACGIGGLAYAKHKKVGGATDLENYEQMRDHLKRTGDVITNGDYKLIDAGELLSEHSVEPPRKSITIRFNDAEIITD